MGNSQSDEDDEKNAHKVLVIQTKDSHGHKLIGQNQQGGYYHSKKYVSFSHSDTPNITIALSLWDTPAINYTGNVHEKVTSQYYHIAHGLFCVYNVESIESYNLICKKITQVYKNPQKTPFKDTSKVSMILVGHKTKHFNESMRKVPFEKANAFANAVDITCFEVNSTNYQDMSDLYTIMGKQIYQIYGELPLKQKQYMTEMPIVTHNNNIPNNNKNNNNNDKKDNYNIKSIDSNHLSSDNESESLSELSDLENPKFSSEELSLPTKHRSSNEDSISMREEKVERKHKDSIECNPVSMRFKKFIEIRVQMPYLYELFSAQNYDDIRMIEYFDEDMLKNEIGIKNLIHRKLFLQQCNDFKYEIEQFRKWLVDRLQLRRYLPIFEANGLITMNQIAKEINSQSDFQLKLKIVNKNHQKILWDELQIYEQAFNDQDFTLNFNNLNNLSDQKNNSNSSTPNKSMTPNSVPTPNKNKIVKTKMTSAYANIQRNRNIFNQITKTNKYKQETSRKMLNDQSRTQQRSKSTRDLESMMTKLTLNPQKSWQMQRSSSITSTKSLGGSSTPRHDSPANKPTKKRVKKRRKSFSLGM